MKRSVLIVLALVLVVSSMVAQGNLKVSVSVNEAEYGRLILILSKDFSKEPRFLVTDDYKTQIAVGMDILPGETPAVFNFPNEKQYTYPIKSWSEIPSGTYNIQAVLNRYDKFDLSTGHSVLLPPDMGEGQQWNTKPMNIYSVPQKVTVSDGYTADIKITLDQYIEVLPAPKNTAWIRHISMKSEKLSKFWGRDIYLGAHILLPRDWDKETTRKYPVMINHGHYPSDFAGFRPEPVPANMDTSDYSERFKIYGYNKFQQEEAHRFYKQWTSDTFPRFLIVEIQHATPYYDDSYAVNSACQGPYGDAITYELIPYIESIYRGIGNGKARFLYGGSTGGWEALAAQVFYPDEYNGCFAACPDPIDFRAYTSINIYDDKNAYQIDGPNTCIDRPSKRDYLGHISSTIRQTNRYELVLGTKSRSGQQFDIWEATYSPMDKDGYPKRIYDKETGVIDKDVAAYWKENYDLVHIMKRDWATLGPKLEGKIHLYCGDMDNYYLNNAVYLAEEFLKSAKPAYKGEVKYGDRAEHCWNGDPNLPNYVTRLRYHTMYLNKIKQRLKAASIKF
jgi:Putative esterase